MKYLREWKDGSGTEELTKAEAKEYIKKWYPDMTDADMEEIMNKPGFSLNCMFGYLTVTE